MRRTLVSTRPIGSRRREARLSCLPRSQGWPSAWSLLLHCMLGNLGGCAVWVLTRGPMGFCVRYWLAWCVDCFFSLCSFGVKLMDFQAYRRGGTLNRKHVSPAFQPPLPPTDGSTLAPAGPEPPSQSSRAESSAGGGPVPSSTCALEQGPSPGDSR